MLDGVNDGADHARQLVKLVRAVPCKINLIPFNPFPQSGYRVRMPQRSRVSAISLMRSDKVVTVRKTRGDDIDAACGQLAGQVQDRTRRQQRRVAVATL